MSDEATPERLDILGLGSEDGGSGARPRPPEDAPEGWQAVVERLRRSLRRRRLRPEALEPGRWWNGSLRSTKQLDVAAERAKAVRLPGTDGGDRTWDSLEALELMLGRVDATARIADIGLRSYRPLLSWLSLLGFGRLPRGERVRARANRLLAGPGGGVPEAGDALLGEEDRYAVVTCRSLPGDRVRLVDRLRQAHRLLHPGGLFVLSTEFWDLPDPYQGGTRRCADDHICCRSRARSLARHALEMDLVPVAPVFLDRPPHQRHRDLLGVGVSPVKLAFRRRDPDEGSSGP